MPTASAEVARQREDQRTAERRAALEGEPASQPRFGEDAGERQVQPGRDRPERRRRQHDLEPRGRIEDRGLHGREQREAAQGVRIPHRQAPGPQLGRDPGAREVEDVREVDAEHRPTWPDRRQQQDERQQQHCGGGERREPNACAGTGSHVGPRGRLRTRPGAHWM